ncbi:hypothetical protein AL755_16965 [Arthrobacter sp. ERGS1:01]|uniref:FUSC family protein n=1 Tax=Arthrobacter sp. ERGS1:01 TaxID=1704044 RepID=UPI0006B64A18|nr:FUSC family protein [Arthrobacter sp. ERGS1:01]ALE06748.1 hypothetical protein AL755_16965 [Arthrobacter sp. ERGS1:01]
MTTTARLQHFGTALTHPVSQSAWRNAMRMRPADAWFAPAMKVGVAATLVLVAGGLLGQPQLAGIASLGALTSAFGRYQPYSRLARQLAVVAVALLAAALIGALMGASGTSVWLQIAVLSVLAGAAAQLFTGLGITGPGPVILVFAASAGAGFAHSFSAIPQVGAAVGIGAVVGWLVALAPVLVVPLGPARLATARAIAAVVRLGRDDGGTSRAAAEAAVGNARTSVALSTRAWGGTSERNTRLRRQAGQLHALLEDARAALDLAGTPGFREAADQLAEHEAALRTVLGVPELDRPAVASSTLAAPSLRTVARTGLASRANLHQALRMAAASALAGWAAAAFGLGHPLWAAMGAVATLQGLNYSMTVQRGIQRLLGNVAGALLAVALLSLSLGFWPSVAMVVVFQVAAELLVLKNYTLTTIAVTPMALIMTGLGSHLGPEAAMTRVVDTLVGVVIGVLVAAVSISRTDKAHLNSAA